MTARLGWTQRRRCTGSQDVRSRCAKSHGGPVQDVQHELPAKAAQKFADDRVARRGPPAMQADAAIALQDVRARSQRAGTWAVTRQWRRRPCRWRRASSCRWSGPPAAAVDLAHVAAGLLAPSSGRVTIYGRPLEGINARAGYMFQTEALMPWRNALDNVTAGLQFRGVDPDQATAQGSDWLKRVGLSGSRIVIPINCREACESVSRLHRC